MVSSNNTSLKAVNREHVLSWLAENVPESRLNHILRVEEMAAQLAKHHHLDAEKAAIAGLMHDLAKYFKPQKLLEMARAENLYIDPVAEASPHLLHANVSAIVARDTFGVEDQEILQGITNHTLGRPEMDLLSCIVFLADSLEPGRGSSSELEALRKLSYQNLDQAVWRTSDYSLRFLIEQACLIHPQTIATRNWFLQTAKNKQPLVRAASQAANFC